MSAAVQAPPQKPKVLYYPGPSYLVGRMTYDEYIAFERDSEERHELLDGKVYKMPGGTPHHSLIGGNALRAFGNVIEAENLDCDVYTSDQKVYVTTEQGLYPDMTIVCGAAEFERGYALLNPNVIVEVLSPSTEGYDRGRKFEKYQKIASLRHYLIVEQERVSVTHFEKIAGNLWAIVGVHNHRTDSVSVTLGEAKITVPVAAIYRRVDVRDGDIDIEPEEAEEE